MTGITLKQIGYDILEFYRANIKNADDIGIRQIYFWIHNTRAKLLKQKFDKPFAQINEAYIQNLPVLAMELIDASLISSIESTRYILRSIIELPITIERSNFSHTFTRLGPPDGVSQAYTIIDYDDISTYGNGKFNDRSVAAFLVNNRIGLTCKDSQSALGIQNISGRGVFQNPMMAGILTNPNFNEDSDYPITYQLVEEMKSILLGDTNFKLTDKPSVNTDKPNSYELEK